MKNGGHVSGTREISITKHIVPVTKNKIHLDLLYQHILHPRRRHTEPHSVWRYREVESASMLPKKLDPSEPYLINLDLKTVPIVFFRDRLFIPERLPINDVDRDEIGLRVKKAVYDEEAELAGLREAVMNMEAAIAFQRSGPRRDPIPEDVKLLVWARDGGACVRCGSKRDLHFDHIIPVAKGGGNLVKNIQILCQPCNLRKSDKIAVD
jgi:hypothetical protein